MNRDKKDKALFIVVGVVVFMLLAWVAFSTFVVYVLSQPFD